MDPPSASPLIKARTQTELRKVEKCGELQPVAMAKSDNPFRWFDWSPEVIRVVVMMYVKFPLSLRNRLDARTYPFDNLG